MDGWVWAKGVITALFVAWLFHVLWIPVILIGVYVAARVLWWLYWRARVEDHRKSVRAATLAARADQQHAWAIADDPRGVYGLLPPSPSAAIGEYSPKGVL